MGLKWSKGSGRRRALPGPSPSSSSVPGLPWRKLTMPYSMMARWALVMLMVLFVSGTPVPTSQLLPQNHLETLPYSVAVESHSAATTGPSASWSDSKANPHLDTRVTLSLDVPIGLLRILLEQARTKAARDQAATNARILARVGRR